MPVLLTSPLTNESIRLPSDKLLISKTDLKGKIVYANRLFMHISELHEGQLLGQPHAIIRHPDMPRGLFRYMWQTLQQGEEFFGIIKNRTASGKHYWVLANVTPAIDVASGAVNGYLSVRRPISESVEPLMTDIYQRMLDIEKPGSQSAVDASAAHLVAQGQAVGGYRNFLIGVTGARLAS